MINDQLNNYIEQNIKQNKSTEEITKSLLKAGWTSEQINEAFLFVKNKHKTEQTNSPIEQNKTIIKKFCFIFIFIIVIVVLIVSYILINNNKVPKNPSVKNEEFLEEKEIPLSPQQVLSNAISTQKQWNQYVAVYKGEQTYSLSDGLKKNIVNIKYYDGNLTLLRSYENPIDLGEKIIGTPTWSLYETSNHDWFSCFQKEFNCQKIDNSEFGSILGLTYGGGEITALNNLSTSEYNNLININIGDEKNITYNIFIDKKDESPKTTEYTKEESTCRIVEFDVNFKNLVNKKAMTEEQMLLDIDENNSFIRGSLCIDKKTGLFAEKYIDAEIIFKDGQKEKINTSLNIFSFSNIDYGEEKIELPELNKYIAK